MPDLIPYSGELASRTERTTGRAVERVQARQTVLTAREVGRVETIADVAEAGLLATSHLSAIEELLVTRTPRAEERLRHIVDAAAVGIVDVVLSTNRRCR